MATYGDQVQFGPVQASPSGENMGGEDSLACTDGGSSSGADNVNSAKTGNKAAKNGSGSQIKNQLEGLAFFQVIAGQMQQAKPANIPKDTSGNSLVGSKALENCSANLQAMFTFNTNAIVKNTNTISAAGTVKGNQPNAISFPTWKVAIGTKPTASDFKYFVVPNGFCYTNQCLDTYLTSVTQNKGADFGKLIKSPNMGAPSAGKTCGLANGACATLGVFRLDNVSPLTYQCSTASSTAAGIPAACGTTKWTRNAVTGATAPFGVPPYTGVAVGQPVGTGNTAPTDTMYINTQAAVADLPLSAAAGTITRTAWDGQEWPEPRLITGAFVGAPKI